MDSDKCIKCGRCADVCQNMQNVWALEFIGRGEKTVMAPAAGVKLAESPCIKCGQCSAHCPVGAIYENDETKKVWSALQDPEKVCLVQIAPAVRAAAAASAAAASRAWRRTRSAPSARRASTPTTRSRPCA